MGRHRKPLPPLDPTAADHAARLGLAARVDTLMKERGLKASELAAISGVGLTALRDLIGARSAVTLTVSARIAAALELPLAALFADVPYPNSRQATTTIPVRGEARMGFWRSMVLRDEPRGMAADVEPLDERYKAYPRYGIEITDDSMMGLTPPVPRGAIAIYAETSGAGIAIEPGRVYLVHRINGGLVESSFRRVTAYRDRYELVPLTADIERNKAETITVTPEDIEAAETVMIGGLFIAATVRYA